jgi:cytochrome c oxidase cbb3-type subunit III
VILIASLLLTAVTAQSGSNVAEGRQVFNSVCARCHGMDGTGDDGPALNRPALTRVRTEDALREIIRDGIPDRGMPRLALTDNELNQVVAYLRSLGRPAATATVGAPAVGTIENGQAVYQRLDCAACHTVEGRGGSVGPDLSESGLKHERWFLRQAVYGPGESLPKGNSPVMGRGFTDYLPVRVVTNDGRELRGIRVNEDPFTIQIHVPANGFYSFRKSHLRELEKEFGKSLMPSYRGRLGDQDAEDLISYLRSLQRGAR